MGKKYAWVRINQKEEKEELVRSQALVCSLTLFVCTAPLRAFLSWLIYRRDEQTFVSEGICHVLCISHCWAITCWPTWNFSRSQHRSPWKTKLTHGRPSVLVLGQNHVFRSSENTALLVCSLLLWWMWCHLVREKRLWVISLGLLTKAAILAPRENKKQMWKIRPKLE